MRERVGEPVGVVVDRVESLPRDRRQHDQRPRALRRPLGLRQTRDRDRPDRALARRRAPAPRTGRSSRRTGSRSASRPPTRSPRRIGSGSPSRESDEVEAAVERPDLEPRHRAGGHDAERAAQREAAHGHAGPGPRQLGGRDRRRRDGEVARLVAHADGERVVAVGSRAGAVGAGRHLAVPDAVVALAAEAAHHVRAGRVVGAKHAELGRLVAPGRGSGSSPPGAVRARRGAITLGLGRHERHARRAGCRRGSAWPSRSRGPRRGAPRASGRRRRARSPPSSSRPSQRKRCLASPASWRSSTRRRTSLPSPSRIRERHLGRLDRSKPTRIESR